MPIFIHIIFIRHLLIAEMKKGYFLITILLCSIIQSNSYLTFEQFYVIYNRNQKYAQGSQEYFKRQSIYNEKIASFATTTSQVNDVNEFSDWTKEQQAGLKGLNSLPLDQRVSSSQPPQPKLSAPSSLDWRTQNIVTSIKNQGQCGACWAFTTVGLVESYLIQKGKQNISIDLSQQFLLQCTTDSSCSGGFIQNGIDKVTKKIPSESTYPYIGPSLYSGSICNSQGVETNITRNSFYNTDDANLITMLQLGPVAVAIDSSSIGSYRSGIIRCATRRVDHAVILVGYTTDYYIFKNSWGTSWGINGYGYVSRIQSQNCAVTDQAHYLVQSKYEIMAKITIALFVILSMYL